MLVTHRMKMGSSATGRQLQNLHSCDILVWLPAQQSQCRKQNKEWDSKSIFTIFVFLELSLSLTTLWCFLRLRTPDCCKSNSACSSHGLCSVRTLTGKSKMLLCCLLATITITICNLEHCFPSADNYFTVALCWQKMTIKSLSYLLLRCNYYW